VGRTAQASDFTFQGARLCQHLINYERVSSTQGVDVSSQYVGANPCGRPLGQVQDLPLPRATEKIRADHDGIQEKDVVLEHLSGQSASVLALVNDDHAIDDDVGDAHWILMWVSEGGSISDNLGIE